ncbi:ABC transporter transmembrane domain-containing protein [Streptomyces sp. NRAIS4]
MPATIGAEDAASPTGSLRTPSGYRALAASLRPHRRAGLAGALLGMIGSALGLAQPLAAKWLIDNLGTGRTPIGPVLVLAALLLGAAAFSALGQYVLHRTAESVVCSARRRITRRLLRLTVPELDRHEPGDLITRATSDTMLLRQAATQSAAPAVTGVVYRDLAMTQMLTAGPTPADGSVHE